MSASESGKRFRVALSFPGEKRDYVEKVAAVLAQRFGKEKVLYDRYHTAEFARPNLAFYLPELYHKHADLIVVVLCADYEKKEWCGLEWRAIFDVIKQRKDADVMFFRDGDGAVRGIYSVDGYAPMDAFTPEEAAVLILQRLALNEGKPRDFYLDGARGPATPPDFQMAVSKLHTKRGDTVFEGREKVLADLDALWADAMADKAGRARIVSLVAIGGAGKTAVVSRWKDALLAREGRGGVESYFDWSFYSQGSSAHTATTADGFFVAAFELFREPRSADERDPWKKGARLADLVARHRTLLILDGLEPLQHPPGPQQGELKDGALLSLFAGLRTDGRGLCILTTREAIADLAATEKTTTPRWPLDHLTDAAGAAVLRGHGVTGPQAELEAASREVKGHALTLSLMGRYLKKAFGHSEGGPDVCKRDCFHFRKADARIQNGHAFRVFAAYERWLEKEGAHAELAILRLLGLFDRPATPDCLAALCKAPAIPGLTEPLVDIGEQDWEIAVSALVDLDLIETAEWAPVKVSGYGEKEARAEMAAGQQGYTTDLGPPQPFSTPHSAFPIHRYLDAHPLLREYFDTRLKKSGAAPAAHARLYEHLCGSVPYWPEGRDGLLPLYQAVAHGCKAGRFKDAMMQVYVNRILRGTTGSHAFYSRKKLGLLGLDLAAAACFFVEPWRRLAAELPPPAQSWLLNEATFGLRAMNRLAEAREPMRAALKMDVQQENWKNAAITSSNLSELELTLGDVPAAEATAAQSVAFADRSGDAIERMINRTTHADALHQAGRLEESRALFAEAEAMQAERQPEYPLLYSLPGYRYCDLLLAAAERAAWQRGAGCQPADSPGASGGESGGKAPPELAAETAALQADLAATERSATQTLMWAADFLGLLDVALDHLTLGRVHLLRAVLENSALRRPHLAFKHLDTALATLRQAGQNQFLPPALLPCAWLHALAREWDLARQRLDEAFALATRGGKAENGWVGGMRLFLADTLLHRARLFGRRSEYPWPGRTPQDDLAEAAELIKACGYRRRDAELADALEVAKGWRSAEPA